MPISFAGEAINLDINVARWDYLLRSQDGTEAMFAPLITGPAESRARNPGHWMPAPCMQAASYSALLEFVIA